MNQHGVNAREIYGKSDKAVWASMNPATGEHYACLFNLKGSREKKYTTEDASYTSQVIAYTLPYEDVEIQIPVGVNQITLLLDDAGDSYDYDHGDWANARFVLDNGDEVFVTEDDIVRYDAEGSYFKYIKINKNLFDNALNIAGTQYANGIACHANTLIDLRLPTVNGHRVAAFKSRCGVDASAGGNDATSMRFIVFLFDPTGNELMPNSTVPVVLPLNELGFDTDQACRITDGWSKEILGVYKNDEFQPVLEAHQSGFYIITPLNRQTTNSLSIEGTIINTTSADINVVINGSVDESSYVQILCDGKPVGSIAADRAHAVSYLATGMTGVHTFQAKYSGTAATANCTSSVLTVNFDTGEITSIGGTNIIKILDAGKIENKSVDVYNISGQKVRAKMQLKDALNGLRAGIYIVGNKKVII
jgi:hypothetical protein